MKRLICLLIIISFFLCIGACKNEEIEFISPVQLYYCSTTVDLHSEQAIISSEQWEYNGWKEKTRDFLNQYLSGPISTELSSPFPAGGWIVELSQEGNAVTLLLNDNFSRLSPNELTVACACLSMTIFELLNVDAVQIQISYYGSEIEPITMTRDNLYLFDEVQTE